MDPEEQEIADAFDNGKLKLQDPDTEMLTLESRKNKLLE